MVKLYRHFNKKRYKLIGSYKTKKDAQWEAKYNRESGAKVRTVFSAGEWHVYGQTITGRKYKKLYGHRKTRA